MDERGVGHTCSSFSGLSCSLAARSYGAYCCPCAAALLRLLSMHASTFATTKGPGIDMSGVIKDAMRLRRLIVQVVRRDRMTRGGNSPSSRKRARPDFFPTIVPRLLCVAMEEGYLVFGESSKSRVDEVMRL